MICAASFLLTLIKKNKMIKNSLLSFVNAYSNSCLISLIIQIVLLYSCILCIFHCAHSFSSTLLLSSLLVSCTLFYSHVITLFQSSIFLQCLHGSLVLYGSIMEAVRSHVLHGFMFDNISSIYLSSFWSMNG